MNLRARARKLFGRELSEHTVCASKVDHAVLRDVRRRAPAIENALSNPPATDDTAAGSFEAWEHLGEDVWSEFYGQDEPSLRSRDKIDPKCHLNRQIADKVMREESFPDTRAMTRGERLESTLALKGMMESIADSYSRELKEFSERQDEIAQHQDSLDEIDAEMERLRERRQDGEGVGEIDEAMRLLGADKRQTLDVLREAQLQQQQRAGAMQDAVRVAAASAAEAASESAEIASLMPGKQSGVGGSVGIDGMLALHERISRSEVLRLVLEMLGRMDTAMGSVRRTRRKGGYEEMVDIEQGNDLRLVLPAEKVLLTHPVAKLDFYRRYHERSLTQYEMWSEEEQKKGPVIFGTDGSGSMSGAKNVYARGTALSCMTIAHREGRNSAAIEFGVEGQLAEFWFPAAGPLDTSRMLDFAEHFYGGGTDIDIVLRRGVEMIRNEAPFHSADFILVTDGEDYLTDESIALRNELRDMGVRIHGLVIGAAPTPYMIEVCDRVTPVWDFAGPNNASQRLAVDLT